MHKATKLQSKATRLGPGGPQASSLMEHYMAYKKWTASAQQLKPDPRYASKLASKFINCLMWDGQKSVAQRLFYRALDIIK